MKNIKAFLISLLISLGAGGIAGLLSMNSKAVYSALILPAWAPPSGLFPIVWGILYVLMAISAYFISQQPAAGRSEALLLYGWQLFVNVLWPLFFFRLNWYLVAFLWLLLLWYLVLRMIRAFFALHKPAAYLQIPYLLWVTFAAILSLTIVILN